MGTIHTHAQQHTYSMHKGRPLHERVLYKPILPQGYSSGTSSFRVRLHMRVVVLGEAWLALSAQMGTCSRASAAELSACSGSGSFTLTSTWLGENWEYAETSFTRM